MGKLPAYLFYVKDWRTDPALCRVGKTARDTWMDMNCLMFDSEERGVLISGSKPWTDEEVAGAVRGEHSTNLRDIAELLDKGVAFRDQRGAIFCKRMVRDEQERRAAAERKRKSRISHGDVTPTRETATEDEKKEVKDFTKSQNQTNDEEVFLVERHDQAFEGFGSAPLAMGLLGKIGMPSTVANIRVASAAIELASQDLGYTLARATDWHLRQARWNISEGRSVDWRYFNDGMRRWTGESTKQVSKSAERQSNNRSVIAEECQRRYGIPNAGSSSGSDGLQGNNESGSSALVKTTRTLSGKCD